MYTIYINNTLPPALAVHEIYRDIFGPPMIIRPKSKYIKRVHSVKIQRHTDSRANVMTRHQKQR